MAGHLNGLKLLLHVERDSYLDNPTNPFVGLIVLVHDQNTFPFMEQFGFVVQPGVRNLCALKKKEVSYIVFIRISAQPRISAHPKGGKS